MGLAGRLVPASPYPWSLCHCEQQRRQKEGEGRKGVCIPGAQEERGLERSCMGSRREYLHHDPVIRLIRVQFMCFNRCVWISERKGEREGEKHQ